MNDEPLKPFEVVNPRERWACYQAGKTDEAGHCTMCRELGFVTACMHCGKVEPDCEMALVDGGLRTGDVTPLGRACQACTKLVRVRGYPQGVGLGIPVDAAAVPELQQRLESGEEVIRIPPHHQARWDAQQAKASR